MIRTVIVLLAITASLYAIRISPSNCGRRPLFKEGEEEASRIVNGTEAIPGDWSWSVSIRNPFGHFCGGVLIRKRWVLCAAHCFSANATATNQFTVSVTHTRSPMEPWAQAVNIETVFKHEKYNSQKITDDISLIRLKSDIKYDNDYAIPACIAEDPDDFDKDADSFDTLIDGKEAWITGWGHNRYGGSLFIKKNQVRLDPNTNEECLRQYPTLFVKEVEICAGNSSSLQGACQGDSGGPYVVKSPRNGRWYNFGLTSWGYNCGIGTVFTRVTNYIGWIKQKMALYPDEDDENTTPRPTTTTASTTTPRSTTTDDEDI